MPTLFQIVVYLIASYALHWLVIFHFGAAHFTKNKDPVLRKKYTPFIRTDMHTWHTIWTAIMIPTYIPRICTGVALLAIYGITTSIIMIGVNPDRIDKVRYSIIKVMGWFICRGILLVSGLVWIKTEYMEDVNYKKWLGPDWKPEWTGSGTLVANHINGHLDVLSAMCIFYPAFAAKKSMKNFPFVGTILHANDPILIDRQGTKEERETALKAIE